MWAGEGMLDAMLDESIQVSLDYDQNEMHHVFDKHHEDGHDCHMSAHLVGLNSKEIFMLDLGSTQTLPIFNINYTNSKLPPPNKPPRA